MIFRKKQNTSHAGDSNTESTRAYMYTALNEINTANAANCSYYCYRVIVIAVKESNGTSIIKNLN